MTGYWELYGLPRWSLNSVNFRSLLPPNALYALTSNNQSFIYRYSLHLLEPFTHGLLASCIEGFRNIAFLDFILLLLLSSHTAAYQMTLPLIASVHRKIIHHGLCLWRWFRSSLAYQCCPTRRVPTIRLHRCIWRRSVLACAQYLRRLRGYGLHSKNRLPTTGCGVETKLLC